MEQKLQIPDIQCPFYIAALDREILCEGCGDATTLLLRYKGRSRWKKQLRIFCCDAYRKCEVYRMLMETKYDQ